MNNKAVLAFALLAGAVMVTLFVLGVNEVLTAMSHGHEQRSAGKSALGSGANEPELESFHQTNEYMKLLSRNLKPIDANLQPGKKFDVKSFLPCTCDGAWMILPVWANGVWASAPPYATTDVWSYDYLKKRRVEKPHTFKARFSEAKEIGLIKDKRGRIWHHTCVPYIFREKTDGVELISEMTLAEPLKLDKSRFGFHWRWVGVKVDKSSNIREAFQCESIAVFSKADDKNENVDQTVRKYDASGNPVMDYESLSKKVRVHDFKPVVKQYGHDVAPLFQAYLRGSRQSNLIP